ASSGGGRGAQPAVSFLRRGTASFVRTADSSGPSRELPVAYTFGVEPLQQLLVPAHGGRYQVFASAWDSRPRAAGGQRWFPLDGGAPPAAGSTVHWEGRDANWNSMCAECHSTGVRKGYRPAEDRFETTFA